MPFSQNGNMYEVLYNLLKALIALLQQFSDEFVQDRLTTGYYSGTKEFRGTIGLETKWQSTSLHEHWLSGYRVQRRQLHPPGVLRGTSRQG
jgi:hypothetical protein